MKNPKKCLFISLLGIAISASASELLPDPFELPETPSVQTSGSCRTCAKSTGESTERPYLNAFGKASLDIDLAADFSPFKHNILKLRLGTAQPFIPNEGYLLLPPGAEKGSKEYLIAYLGDERKILFKAKVNEDIGTTSYASENYPEMSIKRIDKDLVLSDYKERMEYSFSSTDGVSWRISSVHIQDLPAKGFACEYDKDGKLSALIYADKSKHTIEYKNGSASRIISPSGAATEIKWNENGFVKEVKTTIPSDHPFYPENMKILTKGKQVPFVVQDLHLEYEKEGGITSLINTEGEKFSAEYRSDTDKKTNTKYVLAILTYPDNKRLYTRVDWAADMSKIIENGYVAKDVKNSEVFEFEKKTYMKKIGPTYVIAASETLQGRTEFLHDSSRPIEIGKKDVLDRSTTYIRDDRGRRSAIIYPDGSSESFKYDDKNRLIEKTDEIGAVTSYKYIDNKLAAIDDKGITTVYLYSASGMPAETKLADGTVHKFTFDELGRVLSQINPNGTKTVYSYFKGLNAISSMEIISSDEKASYARIFSYEPAGRLAKITYPDKTFESFKYSCCALTEAIDRYGAVTKFIYDAGHRKVAEITHSGEKTQYEYDIRNNVIKIIRPDKTFTSYKYDFAKNKIEELNSDETWIKYEYDKGGNKVGLSRSDGRTAKFAHDLRGRVVSVTGTAADNFEYTYDKAGNTVSVISYGLPRADKGRGTAFKYDDNGRLSETIQADGSSEKNFYQGASNRLLATLSKGIVTRYGFDSAGRINAIARYSAEDLKQCQTSEARNALFEMNIMEKRSYSLFGKFFEVLGREESKGGFRLLARYDYTPDGQLNSILKPVSESGAEKLTYAYAFKGDGFKEISIYRKLIEHPDLSELSYNEKVAYGCVASKDDLIKSDETQGILLSKTLEKAGKKVYFVNSLGEKSFFEYDKAGRLTKVLDEKKDLKAEYTYDKNGRQDSTIDPLGRVYRNIYGNDGRIAGTENPLGEKSEIDYNKFGRLSERSGAGGYNLSYSYTPFGEIESYTDGNGVKTSFKYDDSGRLVSRIWADGSTINYEYNDKGLLWKKTESDRTTVYTYDSLNRLVKIEVLQLAEKVVTELKYNEDSMLSKITEGNGVVEFGYDSFARITFEKGSVGEIKYSYNAVGLLSAKTCLLEGKEFKTEYFYDELDRVVKVVSPAGEYVYSYDGKSRIATLSFGNVKIKNDYDKVGRLASRKMNDTVICSYEYDKLDRRIKAELNGVTWLYKYDIKGQLVSASSSDGKIYGYAFDPIGNIISDGTEKYDFNSLNQIARSEMQDKKVVFEYDKYGNLVKSADAEYKYDLHNRLVDVKKTDTTVRYSYDPLGQRISSVEKQNAKEKSTKFLVSEMMEMARVVDNNIQFHTIGLDLSGSLTATGAVGGVLNSSGGRQVDFNYLYDGNGNVISTCDNNGGMTNIINYSPFGVASVNGEIPFTFSTKPVDSSQLYYFGNRYYSSELSRWFSRDPLMENGGFNIYCMVNNNPIDHFDIYGLVDFYISPENASNIPWSWGSNMSSQIGLASLDMGASCICDTGCNLKCNASLVSSIKITDIFKNYEYIYIKFANGKFKINIEGVYGHEQRHIVSAQQLLKNRMSAYAQGKEKKYASPSACEDVRKKVELDLKASVLEILTIEINHTPVDDNGVLVPAMAQYYPPLDGKMPGNQPPPIKNGEIYEIDAANAKY